MGRPPLVDRESIVRAAVDVGFAQLTVSAVANRLGVSHSALYRYFGSRDALASAAVDWCVESVEWPQPGADWRGLLRATARAYWELYERHAGLATEVSMLRTTSRALVAINNGTGLALLDLGFGAEDAVVVLDMLGELVTQAFLGASSSPDTVPGEERPHTVSVVDGVRQRRVELMEPWLEHYDPRLREALAEAVGRSPRVQFERKLEIFLAGVDARIR